MFKIRLKFSYSVIYLSAQFNMQLKSDIVAVHLNNVICTGG